MINKWWETACQPMGGCQVVFIDGDDIVVWPVWRNPQDENYFSVKVHDLVRDRWTKVQGHFCDTHMKMMVRAWEVETEADVKWMERTDAWAAKNGGNI